MSGQDQEAATGRSLGLGMADRSVFHRAANTARLLVILRDRATAAGGEELCRKRDDSRSIVEWDDALASVTADIIDATDSKQRRDALMRSAAEMLAWVQAIDREADAANAR